AAWVPPAGRGPPIQQAGRPLRKCPGLAIKQVVQCKQTRHPFLKTARPRQQFLLEPDGWRSLTINPKMQLCAENTCRVIAQVVVELPAFLQQKQPRRPRRLWF